MSLSADDRPEDRYLPPRSLRDDTRFASGKMAFLQYVALGFFLFLISGFWELQVSNRDLYDEAAERNRIKALPIPAARGKILDREGRVIVDNHSSFSLLLSRETLKIEHVRSIAEGINLDHARLRTRLDRFGPRPRYEPLFIKDELTPADVAFVESHSDPETFPEMELIQAHQRVYPRDQALAHLIGYVGEISESELDSPDLADCEPGDIIGKQGIERQYNHVLKGTDGQRQVIVDNRGRERALLKMKEAIPGKDLALTIDLDLQTVGELAMANKPGAVVALDPRNGEVLALISTPAFDPNQFSSGIEPADWKRISTDPDNPMLNRATQAQLAPGSTFKPFMALAGLETGVLNSNFTVRCPGGASFYGTYFHCHDKYGHGSVDLHRALAQSCDVFFYHLGDKLGIDTIARYADLAGFGHKTGIDLPHEAAGTVPSTIWKKRYFRQKWFAGETIPVSIGQGALTATPLQLASAVGGLAIGGTWHTPHLVKSASLPPPRTHKIDPAHVAQIVSGMFGVVNEGGTGSRAHLPGISVCGKTGTAQVASNAYIKRTGRSRELRDNAWFVAFAPCESPEIVVSVLYQGGEFSKLAVPVARDVLKAYFDKKKQPDPNLRAALPWSVARGPWPAASDH